MQDGPCRAGPSLQFVLFAIPGAIAVTLAWPFVSHRRVPTELDGDAIGILAIALLVGMLVAMLMLLVTRRAQGQAHRIARIV